MMGTVREAMARLGSDACWRIVIVSEAIEGLCSDVYDDFPAEDMQV